MNNVVIAKRHYFTKKFALEVGAQAAAIPKATRASVYCCLESHTTAVFLAFLVSRTLTVLVMNMRASRRNLQMQNFNEKLYRC